MEKDEEQTTPKLKNSCRVQEFVMTTDLSKAEKLEYCFITNQDTSRREFKPSK